MQSGLFLTYESLAELLLSKTDFAEQFKGKVKVLKITELEHGVDFEIELGENK